MQTLSLTVCVLPPFPITQGKRCKDCFYFVSLRYI